MLPEDLKNSIFQSIPKSITIGESSENVYIEKAERMNFSQALNNNLIAASIGFANIREDAEKTPTNSTFGKQPDTETGTTTRLVGARYKGYIVIVMEAKNTDVISADELFSKFSERLVYWYRFLLPSVITTFGNISFGPLEVKKNGDYARTVYAGFAFQLVWGQDVAGISTINSELVGRDITHSL